MCAQYSYNHPAVSERLLSSPRRQHAVRPPTLLTTSLGNAHTAGSIAQTPLSTTSLSSPFAYPQLAYPASPGGAMRGTSPMQFRSTVSYPTAYNPQQWGPVSSNTSPNSSTAITGHTHLPQSSRITALARRPVGPDGMIQPSSSYS